MSLLEIGDILQGRYVDMSLRHYKVIKVTDQKIKVLQLKHNQDDNPGYLTHGKELIMTKFGTVGVIHYGTIYTRI